MKHNESLQQSDIRQWIESIVRELVHFRNEPAPAPAKVLFIFCDSTAHEPYIDVFIELNQHHIGYDMMFLDGETSSWLGKHRIECAGVGKVIAADEYAPAPIELPGQYDGIIVPEIDLDNAARICHGMKGTIKAEVVLAALIINKFVLIGEGGSGLRRSDRRCLQTTALPPSFQTMFTNYLQQLEALGVHLAGPQQLARTIIEQFAPVVSKQAQSPETVVHSDGVYYYQGRVLTAEWINKHRNHVLHTVAVSRNTIISALAADMLKEKGIAIKQLEEG